MLYARSGADNDFHWAIYHHIDSTSGWKYHITGSTFHWHPAHEVIHRPLVDHRLICLVKLKEVGMDDVSVAAVKECILAEDDLINERPEMTCRIYMKMACDRLKDKGILTFPGWTELQGDAWEFGNKLNPFVVFGEPLEAPRQFVFESRVVQQ